MTNAPQPTDADQESEHPPRAVKVTYVVRRRPDLSAQEFQDYWEHRHAALAKEIAGTMRIRRYIQSPTVDTPLNDAFNAARGIPVETPPDGVAQVWWDSLDDLIAAFSSPEGESIGQRLIEDEAHFIDFATSRAWIAEERQII